MLKCCFEMLQRQELCEEKSLEYRIQNGGKFVRGRMYLKHSENSQTELLYTSGFPVLLRFTLFYLSFRVVVWEN